MAPDDAAADAALFASLRSVWSTVDPMPADFVDRMVAAVAVADLSREYALLTLVDGADRAAVRGETDTLTLQFSDGHTSVLLHVTDADGARRRIDGWVDGTLLAVSLVHGERLIDGAVEAEGRFAFADAPAGLARVRLAVDGEGGAMREFETPQFEV